MSISDFLTLFSARTHNGFFWSDKPSPWLMLAAFASLAISTIVACFWGDGIIDGQHVRGLALKSAESSYTLWALWVWIYCIIWWFIQVRNNCGKQLGDSPESRLSVTVHATDTARCWCCEMSDA